MADPVRAWCLMRETKWDVPHVLGVYNTHEKARAAVEMIIARTDNEKNPWYKDDDEQWGRMGKVVVMWIVEREVDVDMGE